MIYTTKTVKGYHRQIHKVTKNKGAFPNDTALANWFTSLIAIYVKIGHATGWEASAQQLAIKFGDRFKLL